MKRRRRLRDLLTIAAGEPFPHRLDHFPLTRLRFQRSRHVIAELAQPMAATALASRRRINHHALAGEMVRERVAVGSLAREAGHRGRLDDGLLGRQFVFCCAGLQLFESERQLIYQARRAFRSLSVDLALQLRNPQFLLGDQRNVF